MELEINLQWVLSDKVDNCSTICQSSCIKLGQDSKTWCILHTGR